MADPKVKFDIEANAVGEPSIAKMASTLQDMGNVLEGPLKSKAQAASDALTQLGEKRAAIDAFVALKNEAAAAAARVESLQIEAQALGRTLSQTVSPTKLQVGQMEKLRDSVNAAKSEFITASRAVDVARSTLSGYGISSTSVATANRQISDSVRYVKREYELLEPVYKSAADAAQNSATSQNKSHRQIRDGVDSISVQLGRLQTAAGLYYGALNAANAVKGFTDTADQFKNLEARIKLATGEGDLFNSSLLQIIDISKRTNSELTNTGNLFTRLADAGKNAGLSSQDAVNQALGLTETINQAVQLSGAGAQASNAAITQLIQGLQSGVLRGDEFNSVMEQAPRLAKALADGLGVTTGELRKMAESGQLSADVVIKALQGQSGTLKKEFSTLPETVGRALTNLSTNWSVYVSEVDKSMGVSHAAAVAIKALSENLNFIGSSLWAAGKAAAAFQALKLAQTFIGIGQSAGVASAQVGAANAAMAASGGASTVAAAGVGRLAGLLSSLKTFSLIGIVTNLGTIGTALGEGIAKLQGYKDKTDELAAADKRIAEQAVEYSAAMAAKRAAADAAAAAQFGLSKGAQAAVAEFDKLRTSGDSATEAIGKIGKNFDAESVKGIQEMAGVLDKLVTSGKVGAQDFEQAWAKALKAVDLGEFEVKARAAFAGSAREAERLTQMLDQTTREAIRRAGLDFDLISGGMGKAAKTAINDTQAIINNLDGLGAKGIDVGRVLNASLTKAINTADSEQALSQLRSQIEQVRGILGDKIANGLLDQATDKANALKAALEGATPGVNSVAEALRDLGVTTDASLTKAADKSREAFELIRASGTASAREVGLAFERAAQDAIAANKGIAPSWLAQFESLRQIKPPAGGPSGPGGLGPSPGGGGGQAQPEDKDAVEYEKKRLADLERINARYNQGEAERAGRNNGGNSWSVLKKDDLGPVDNQGLVTLQEKRRAGTLSKDDLATAEGVFRAAQANMDVYQKNQGAFSISGAQSIDAVYRESKAILEMLKAQTLSSKRGESGRAVTVNLNLGGRSAAIPTDDKGAKDLISLLRQSKLAAGY